MAQIGPRSTASGRGPFVGTARRVHPDRRARVRAESGEIISSRFGRMSIIHFHASGGTQAGVVVAAAPSGNSTRA